MVHLSLVNGFSTNALNKNGKQLVVTGVVDHFQFDKK